MVNLPLTFALMEYDDIIKLPHHVSKRHPQMPMEKRAAQFAPFTALEGYRERIEEVLRVSLTLFIISLLTYILLRWRWAFG